MQRRERESREFGIKLAQALRQRAIEAANEYDLDARYVALGAAEYLRKRAELELKTSIDVSRTDPGEREN